MPARNAPQRMERRAALVMLKHQNARALSVRRIVLHDLSGLDTVHYFAHGQSVVAQFIIAMVGKTPRLVRAPFGQATGLKSGGGCLAAIRAHAPALRGIRMRKKKTKRGRSRYPTGIESRYVPRLREEGCDHPLPTGGGRRARQSKMACTLNIWKRGRSAQLLSAMSGALASQLLPRPAFGAQRV